MGESKAQRLASRPRSPFWLLSSQLWSVWILCDPLVETRGETESDGGGGEKRNVLQRIGRF